MTNKPKRNYRQELRDLAQKRFPDLVEFDLEIERRKTHLADRDERGRKTSKTNQAVQFLSNSKFKTTTVRVTRRRIELTKEEAEADAANAAADALYKAMLADQAALELTLFDEAQSVIATTSPSRKSHQDGDDMTRFLRPLLNALDNHDVAPSTCQRSPVFLHDFVARLYADYDRDPEMQDDLNLLGACWRAGMFEAYRGEMDPQQAKAANTAMAMERSPHIVELQRAFAEGFPDSPPVSSYFLLGCARIRDQAGRLSQGAAQAVSDALGIVYDGDAKVVAAILDLDDSEQQKAEAVATFLRQQSDDDILARFEASTTFSMIRLMIDQLSLPDRETADWLPQFVEKITILAETLQNEVSSEKVFWALMYGSFEYSRTKEVIEQTAEMRKADELEAINAERLVEALASRKPFKFDDRGWAIIEGEDGYNRIPGEPHTRADYLGSARREAEREALDAVTDDVQMKSGAVFGERAAELDLDITRDIVSNSSEADDISTAKASGGTDEAFTGPSNHVADAEEIAGDPVCTDDDAGAPLVDASKTTDYGGGLAGNPGLQSGASEIKIGSQEDSEATIAPSGDPLHLSDGTGQNILPADEIRRDDRLSSTRDDDLLPSEDHGRRELISAVHSDAPETSAQKPEEERKGILPRPIRHHPSQPSEIKDEDML